MEYRRSLLADPRQPSCVMLTHVATCPECTLYTERLLRFEGFLGHALRVRMPAERERPADSPAARPRLGAAPRSRRVVAIAASVLLAAVGAGSLWLGAAGPSLAAAVVDHMAGEPNAWTRTAVVVPELQLNEVMSASGMHMKSGAATVTYANSCEFRGHRVPHLVVQTPTGPVTVMVLTRERVRHDVRFNEQGYRGMIIPVRGLGSLAVLEQIPNIDEPAMEAVAAQVLSAIEWKG